MAIDPLDSDRLRLTSGLCILLVMCIHSQFHLDELEGLSFAPALQRFVCGGFSLMAVPTFFAISGLLFFRDAHCLTHVVDKLRRRVHSLLIPYLIACPLYIAICVGVQLAPFTASNSNGDISPILSQPFLDLLYTTYWDVSNGPYHMWFVRDLMLCMLLTPPLLYVVNAVRPIEPVGTKVDETPHYATHSIGDLCRSQWPWGVVAVLMITQVFLPSLSIVPIRAVAYFTLGAVAGRSGLAFRHIPKTLTLALLLASVLLATNRAFQLIEITPILATLSTLVAMVALHALTGELFKRGFRLQRHQMIARVCRASFFIYLYHAPLLNVPRKLIVLLLGRSELGFSVSFLLSPIIFALLATGLYLLLRRYVPRLLGILTGGR